MPTRIDYFGDPRAPKANSVVPSANVMVRQEFSVVFTASYLSGEPTPSDESREVVWVPHDKVHGLKMDRSMRHRIDAYLQGEGLPQLG